MRISHKFSFTITLKPFVTSCPPVRQYDMTHNFIKYTLEEHPQVHRVTMVAELTKTCNIHYHGMIDFVFPQEQPLDQINVRNIWFDIWRTEGIPKLDLRQKHYCTLHHIGFTDFRPVTDERGWIEYMKKDFKTFKDTVRRLSMIVDDHHCFGTEEVLHGYQPDPVLEDDEDFIYGN